MSVIQTLILKSLGLVSWSINVRTYLKKPKVVKTNLNVFALNPCRGSAFCPLLSAQLPVESLEDLYFRLSITLFELYSF